MRRLRLGMATIAIAATSLTSVNAWAIDEASVPENKQTMAKLYLGAEEVIAFLASKNGKALFVDVRTPAELMFVGNTPAMTANVPLKRFSTKKFNEKKGKFVLEDNPKFVAQVERLLAAKSLTKADPVVVMCKAGGRSALAADDLTVAGFKQVYTVIDGFEGDKAKKGPNAGQRVVNGWRNKGQPWGYKLDKAKLMLDN